MKLRNVHRQRARGRRGSALLLSFITVLAVAVLAAGYMQMSSAVTRRQGQAIDRKEAFYMAEAGLAEAFAGMMIGKTGNVGTREAPAKFGRGCFWVEAEDAGANLVDLEATGLYGGGRATLSVVVEKGGQSVASLGIFCEGALSIPGNVAIDGYDSSLGTYAEQAGTSTTPLEVGSNAGITVDGGLGGTTIGGSVVPGVGSSVTLVGTPTITGSKTPRMLDASLPWVTPPMVAMGSGVVATSSTPVQLASGTYGMSSLQVLANAKVVFHGPARIVVGNATVQPCGEIQFDTTLGPIELYVNGNLNLTDGSIVSTTSEDPTQVIVQLPNETTGTLHAYGAFHGTVYGPRATLSLGAALEFFGSLIADQLEIQSGSKVHFDNRLAVVGAASTLPTQFSWRIVDFAPLGPEQDPFKVLGVNPNTLELPADAHADQQLDVNYVDRLGGADTYSGMESAFDWTKVSVVNSLTRDGQTTALATTKTRSLLAGVLGLLGL